MSFLLDAVLIGLFLVIVVFASHKSIFSSGFGTVAAALSVCGALLLTPYVGKWVSQTTVTPLLRVRIANELADMDSAPHLSSPEETVAALPLYQWVETQPETYEDLLKKYNVTPEDVRAVYAPQRSAAALLDCIARPLSETISTVGTLILLSLLLSFVLQLIVRRMEQNLPPARRYRGIKRAIPALFGVACGLIWSWLAVIVLERIMPMACVSLPFLPATTLQETDWASFLQRINPLSFLSP